MMKIIIIMGRLPAGRLLDFSGSRFFNGLTCVCPGTGRKKDVGMGFEPKTESQLPLVHF